MVMEQNPSTPTWYLGHCITRNPDGTIKVEDLLHINQESSNWKKPSVPDIADIKTEDITVYKIVAEKD